MLDLGIKAAKLLKSVLVEEVNIGFLVFEVCSTRALEKLGII